MKISFIVAGYEFDNLKTAQFFQRAIRLHKLETESPEACAAFLIDHWNGLLFGGKNPMGFTTQQVVELIHSLQLPKPARKKKEIQNYRKEDFCLDGPMFQGEQQEAETKSEMLADDDEYSANTSIFDINGVRLN